ncbi:MAG: hypothetical protein IMZ46_05655 [Acidobacteria bacterium]|nr:hypothetical protein [Acidobacteriota bacterium]
MPYEDGFDVEEALAILAKPKREGRRSYIVRYEVSGERFIQILSWARHQRPHKNEKASEIPSPPREERSMSDKGRTQDGQKHDKGRTLEHGDWDCDCDGDCDGDGDRDGECEGKTKKINPPAPIQGSGQAPEAVARPVHTITEGTLREILKVKSKEEVIAMLKQGNYPIPEFLLGGGEDINPNGQDHHPPSAPDLERKP